MAAAQAFNSVADVRVVGDAAEEAQTPQGSGFHPMCIGNMSPSEMKSKCEAWTAEEKCTGVRHDWFCDPSKGAECKHEKENVCLHVREGAADFYTPVS